MKELNNKILSHINNLVHSLLFWVISLIENLYLKLIGVEANGWGTEFRGWTSVFKAADSSIIIGRSCVFNSNFFSNHIGIHHRCIISTMEKGSKVQIGEGCGFSGVAISSFKSIEIGRNVRCGANVIIMDGDFHLDDTRVSAPEPIIIEDNVWLGEGVKVLKGVRIGKNSLIGIGSIVTKDIPADVIAAGNPCKVIRTIEN